PQRRVSACSDPSPHAGQLYTFERVVHDYATRYQPRAEREMRWYAIQPSLEKAEEVAALSKLPDGKKHSHQHRLRQEVLEEARGRLLMADLRSSKTFHDLYLTV